MIYTRTVQLPFSFYKYLNKSCSRMLIPQLVAANVGLLIGDLAVLSYDADFPAMFFDVQARTKSGNYRLYRIFNFEIQESLFPTTTNNKTKKMELII